MVQVSENWVLRETLVLLLGNQDSNLYELETEMNGLICFRIRRVDDLFCLPHLSAGSLESILNVFIQVASHIFLINEFLMCFEESLSLGFRRVHIPPRLSSFVQDEVDNWREIECSASLEAFVHALRSCLSQWGEIILLLLRIHTAQMRIHKSHISMWETSNLFNGPLKPPKILSDLSESKDLDSLRFLTLISLNFELTPFKAVWADMAALLNSILTLVASGSSTEPLKPAEVNNILLGILHDKIADLELARGSQISLRSQHIPPYVCLETHLLVAALKPYMERVDRCLQGDKQLGDEDEIGMIDVAWSREQLTRLLLASLSCDAERHISERTNEVKIDDLINDINFTGKKQSALDLLTNTDGNPLSFCSLTFHRKLTELLKSKEIINTRKLVDTLFGPQCLLLEYLASVRSLAFLEGVHFYDELLASLYYDPMAKGRKAGGDLKLVDTNEINGHLKRVFNSKETYNLPNYLSYTLTPQDYILSNNSDRLILTPSRLATTLSNFTLNVQINPLLNNPSSRLLTYRNMIITCRVPKPIAMFLDERTMLEYSALLSYTIELRRAHSTLREISVGRWVRGRKTKKYGDLLILARFEVSKFISKMLYALEVVSRNSWLRFYKDLLEKGESLHRLVECHRLYVTSMLAELMIPIESRREVSGSTRLNQKVGPLLYLILSIPTRLMSLTDINRMTGSRELVTESFVPFPGFVEDLTKIMLDFRGYREKLREKLGSVHILFT